MEEGFHIYGENGSVTDYFTGWDRNADERDRAADRRERDADDREIAAELAEWEDLTP